jgi:5-methylcytosine-specific restriction protein A
LSADRKSEADRRRGSGHARGYTYRWLRLSRDRLKRFPWCAEHERQGQTVQATVTDHIRAHKGDARLFWNEANLQSLCKRCHDRKSAREDGGFGNRIQP